LRILIVEDEQRARRGLHNLITMISDTYEVVGAAQNGKQALEMIQTIKPDVVFTDIKMPYMNGMSMIKAIQVLNMNVEIVIISAYEEFETARQAISLGVREYLIKPVTIEEMEEVLKKLEKKTVKKPGSELQKQYPDAHPQILKALDIIEKSYAAKIRQKEIAESLGMTQEYFSYLFNRDVGENFSAYLKKYRIKVAQSLLLNDAVDKKEVPYSVGFSDPKYFNKVFKEITSMSVSEYLKTH
jgi:YesN/AraC family two-component response regulator